MGGVDAGNEAIEEGNEEQSKQVERDVKLEGGKGGGGEG